MVNYVVIVRSPSLVKGYVRFGVDAFLTKEIYLKLKIHHHLETLKVGPM